MTVVGVSADTATSLQAATSGLYVFMPASQHYSPAMSVVVRTSANPLSVLEPLRQALHSSDPDVAFGGVQTVADGIGFLLLPIRAAAMVFALLAALGFGIAILGVYGVMAYSVSQRTREFGVRRAIGANASQIYGVVLQQGLRIVVVGAGTGLAISGVGAGFLQHVIYGVNPRDPITFVVVPVGLTLAALAASCVPARRAARVEPSVALREL